MSGLWGLINGVIAWYALVTARQTSGQPLPVLWFDSGLDVLCVRAAGPLLGRTKPILRGFRLGVLVLGVFLLFFDTYFWWQRAQAMW
jgi:hypothetical protein